MNDWFYEPLFKFFGQGDLHEGFMMCFGVFICLAPLSQPEIPNSLTVTVRVQVHETCISQLRLDKEPLALDEIFFC